MESEIKKLTDKWLNAQRRAFLTADAERSASVAAERAAAACRAAFDALRAELAAEARAE